MKSHAIVRVSSKNQEFSVTPFDPTSAGEMRGLLDKDGYDLSGFDQSRLDTADDLYEVMAFLFMQWGEDHDQDRWIIPLSKLSSGYSLDEVKKFWTPENQKKAREMLANGMTRAEIIKELDTTIIIVGEYFWPLY